ncbi:transposase [Candidatus Kaiserbacteria bacterium]|nr:transposase [Candidatus Kaiserbacteria bacterium]
MELYHVLNRGVEKRLIFLDEADRARFVHDLWEFNDTEDAKNVWYRVSQNKGLRNHYIEKERIVDLHGWCLMGNHYHLLISEKHDGGLTKFIRRLNVGYANYFNERYRRQGTLFQGRTRKVLISTDAHFLHILNYIHCNPLDFLKNAADWREHKIGSAAYALRYLSNYRWSSYLDYSGVRNFPSVLTTELFSDVFKDYKKEISSFLLTNETKRLNGYQLEY